LIWDRFRLLFVALRRAHLLAEGDRLIVLATRRGLSQFLSVH
jgi:hypothetical protein